jgi:RHS repeat-associated protein
MSVYENSTPTGATGGFTQTEAYLYGSSRLGVDNVNRNANNLQNFDINTYNTTFERGNKFFELSNHLGNVLVTVSDRVIQVQSTTNTTQIGYYLADVITANDYYAFGMTMPGRTFTAGTAYRYGFNGKENDKDAGQGIQDYGLRIYDSRLGKFLSVDPLTKSFVDLTPYQFAANTPIRAIDLDGGEARDAITGEVLGQFSFPSFISDYKPWMDLMSINNSKDIYKKANERLGSISNNITSVSKQTMAGAYSNTVSLDYYSVDISKLPPAFKTANELFDFVRINFADFKKNGGSVFSALTSSEGDLWKSKNPTSAVMHFDVYQWGINTEEFNVINIKTTSDYWLFQTVKTKSVLSPVIDEDREHPLGGIRQFGLQDNSNGSSTFYTRGADSPYGFLDTKVQDDIFSGGHKLWNAVMQNVTDFINKNGGQAQVGKSIQYKFKWDKDISSEDKAKIRKQKED